MFTVNNKNTKITLKVLEVVFTVNFEYTLHSNSQILLITLNSFLPVRNVFEGFSGNFSIA